MLLSRAVNIYIILTYMYFNRCYLLIMRFEYLQEKFLIFLDFFSTHLVSILLLKVNLVIRII